MYGTTPGRKMMTVIAIVIIVAHVALLVMIHWKYIFR